MHPHNNNIHKAGRKLDVFERFENRPKRRPLGDISNHKNRGQKNGLLRKSAHGNQNNSPGVHNNNPNAQKIGLSAQKRPFLASKNEESNHSKKTRPNHLNPFSFFDAKKSKSDSRLPAVRQLSNAFWNPDGLESGRKSESKFIDSQKSLETAEKENLQAFDLRKSVLYTGHTFPSTSSRSMPKMAPYNSVVARSNALIRTFCDEAKLGNPKRTSESAGHVTHIIVKASSPSPLLSAVTTDLGDEILLANTEKVELTVGARLVLGSYTGTHPKMYTSWRLL